jgi:hypothetical protein
MTTDLYTATDIKRERKRLLESQQNIDPILKEVIQEKDAVCDHCHVTQHTRAALHRQTNAFEGLVFNAYKRCLEWVTDKPLSEILRNLADYVEADYSDNPYHNAWLKRVSIDFNKLKESDKDRVLIVLDQPKGSNAKQRKELFRKAVLSRKFGYEYLNLIIKQTNKESN